MAYWNSIAVTPSAVSPPPTSKSSPSGSSYLWLILLVIVVIVLILLLLVRSRRREGLTVTVVDSGTLSPVPRAGVSADGPKYFSGSTGTDGRIVFGGVKAGDYSVTAGATGYSPSVPVTVSVQRTGAHTVRLQRQASEAPKVATGAERPTPQPATAPTQPFPPGGTQPPAVPSPPVPSAPEEREGWGGERIRQIVRTFQQKGALSPETALTAEELGLSRMFVRIMRRRRGKTLIFVEVSGRYYLDQKALQEMEELR